MSKVNTKKVATTVETHGGAKTYSASNLEQLKRAVLTCMLWEDQFYEDGVSIADRIAKLVPTINPNAVRELAIKARNEMKLRHVPLLLVREMARHNSHKSLVADTLFEVIQRPDEIAEFMAIYWKDGKCPVAAQVKKGLSKAFTKFNEYALAKYNSDGKTISLKDVMFMVHAKPKDVTNDMANWNKDARAIYRSMSASNGYPVQFVRPFTEGELLYGRLIHDQLQVPDTWETELSSGKDKKETFERLMAENKLGVLAFLRNLRNMYEAGVEKKNVVEYSKKVKVERALPFRFISAAKHAPQWEDAIESMMLRCLNGQEKLTGKTVLVVDISGSMNSRISGKSDSTRLEVAGALAILVRELAEDVAIYVTAGSDRNRIHQTSVVPPRRGFALSQMITDDMYRTHGGGGIFLKQALDYVYDHEKTADRVIVLTDEQDCDNKANPATANAFGVRNYIINVASYQNGIAYSKFHHINGWSEAVIDYIRECEKFN